MKKAIVLTYASVNGAEKKLLKNTDIFKIACNWHAEELKPDIRITLDGKETIEKSLSVGNQKIISVNHKYNSERIEYACYLPCRHSSLISCCDYLIEKEFTHILLVATNTMTNQQSINNAFQKINYEGINSLKDCAYIYKYSDNGVFDVPTMSIKEFLDMTTAENLILGIKDKPIKQPLLRKLAFSDAYKYRVKTVGLDNESIETGELLNNILNLEQKRLILSGQKKVVANGLEITRITGIYTDKVQKQVKTSEMTYQQMKDFVKNNKIKVNSMKKEILQKAIKEFLL